MTVMDPSGELITPGHCLHVSCCDVAVYIVLLKYSDAIE